MYLGESDDGSDYPPFPPDIRLPSAVNYWPGVNCH